MTMEAGAARQAIVIESIAGFRGTLLSIPSPLRTTLVLGLLLLGFILLVRRGLLPKLLRALLEFVTRAFQLLGTLLLAPVAAVSLRRRRCGRQPWGWVYGYGEAIEALVCSAQAVTGGLQRMLAGRGGSADGGH